MFDNRYNILYKTPTSSRSLEVGYLSNDRSAVYEEFPYDITYGTSWDPFDIKILNVTKTSFNEVLSLHDYYGENFNP